MDKSLALTSSNQTMTSREIAELTGKRHDHVLRDVDNLLKTISPELGNGFKSSTYTDSNGREYRQFELDRDSTYCLVAGYDVNARMKIIKRWQELETQLATPKYRLPQTYLEALKDLVVAHEELEITRPKAAALDLIVTPSAGSMCITDAAKHLQMRRDDLINYLYQSRWVYRRNGNKNLIGYAHILQQGLLEHKLHSVHDENGVVVHESVRVTRKGLRQLAQLLAVLLPFGGEK